jgi:hypothetical protein
MKGHPELFNRTKVDINADCIKRCPFEANTFAVGHYSQIEGENVIGGISIINVDKYTTFINKIVMDRSSSFPQDRTYTTSLLA